jgi:hypothetical protein
MFANTIYISLKATHIVDRNTVNLHRIFSVPSSSANKEQQSSLGNQASDVKF